MNNINKCVNIIEKQDADALLLCNEANMHYICSFSPSEGIILIFKDGTAYHLVDSRYTEIAQKHSKENGLTVIEASSGFENEYKNLIAKHNATNIIFENETISYLQYSKLKNGLNNCNLLCLNNELMLERNRKTPKEIEFMKKANAIAEKSFLELLNYVEVGKTEKELAAQFDYLMAKNGSDGVSFETILLTGKNTSMPHGVPGNTKIKSGDFVLFDFGATYKGYHSDMTRTIAINHATNEMYKTYNLVLEAQKTGIFALKDGAKCKDVYKAAYDVLEKENMGQYFRHGLGHGVGIEIHEGYNASPKSNDTYEIGNVTSIEPGIYLPDKFGIRIEDVCYISNQGTINLSSIDKELLIL